MFSRLHGRYRQAHKLAQGARFAAKALDQIGVFSALSPTGVATFAKRAQGLTLGPHLGLMLHAHNKPEKIALIEGNHRRRYDELDREINQIAQGLAERGVGPRGKVALMLPNCSEYLIVQQALGRLGATGVQIGYRLKAAEIAYILDNAQPDAVVVRFEYLAEMRAAIAAAEGTPSLIVCRAPRDVSMGTGVRYEDTRSGDGSEPPRNHSSEQGGVIVYTSGTTGNPKGANRDYKQTGFESVIDFMSQVGMNHTDRHLIVCPLYHSGAAGFSAMMFSLGATLVVVDHFDAEAILRLIEKERITSTFMVPTQLIRLLALPAKVRARYDTSSLQWVCSGAAPLATETARRFQEAFGQLLWNFYGSTETGLVTLAGPSDHTERPGTIGKLLRGNQVKLVGESGAEVPTGDIGELYARNRMLIAGYHRDESATDRSKKGGFFSVGDLARVDEDGFFYLESRKHDMVISGGVNIYPREIEDHLHTHPDILEAAVIGVPDEEWGETLKAFIVTRPGTSLTEEAVAEFCKRGLADYKRPKLVAFLDDLPHNPTGKVLKRELRAL